MNYNIIRFADIILWEAEALAVTGDLAGAEKDVNLIRARAALPTNWIYQYVNPSDPSKGASTTAAANYVCSKYSGQFAANGLSYALMAILTERQLEFGMEGQRFFDLQRFDGRFGGPEPTGFMAGIQSRDRLLRYSAYYLGVQEFMFALRRQDSLARKELRKNISQPVLNDFKTERNHAR